MADIKNEREQLGQLEALVRDNQLDRAMDLGKEVSEAFPDSFQVQFAYAGVLRRVDELDRARELLVDLQRRYPGNINILLALAEIHRKRQDTDAAAEHYYKVLFFDPFNQAAKDALTALGASLTPPSASPPVSDSPPVRMEVNPEDGETSPDFEISLDDVHPDDVNPDTADPEAQPVADESLEIVLPDETDTFNLDEAGIPVPTLEEEKPKRELSENFGLPMVLNDLDAPAPEAEPEVLRVPEPEPVTDPLPDIEDTAPIRVEPPVVFDPVSEEAVDDAVDFYTQSAAELYMAQGLFDEAAEIFRELYRRTGEDRYEKLLKKVELHRRNRSKIHRLKQLLETLKEDGGPLVS